MTTTNDIDAIRKLTDRAMFIAAARTHVPALCDEVEQLRAAHDSAVQAIAEAESDIDDRDSEISMLRHDLDFQTKAAWDNRSKIEQLAAELEKVRAQLTAANTALANELASARAAGDALYKATHAAFQHICFDLDEHNPRVSDFFANALTTYRTTTEKAEA